MVFDLPAGGRRLVQRVDGYRATVVSGEVTFENGEATGARPGRLVRGAQRSRELASAARSSGRGLRLDAETGSAPPRASAVGGEERARRTTLGPTAEALRATSATCRTRSHSTELVQVATSSRLRAADRDPL